MADYKVRLVAGRYCLEETKNNWIVGCGYNPDRPEGQQWEQGKYFSKANGLTGLLSLHEATHRSFFVICQVGFVVFISLGLTAVNTVGNGILDAVQSGSI